MAKYYIDTSIWRDYYENRTDNLRPLGEWAFMLLVKIKYESSKVLYSDKIVAELAKRYDKKSIAEIFKIVDKEDLLRKVETSDAQFIESAKISKLFGIPKGDALHAILARDNAAILVTRDNHFLQLQEVVKIMKPEELI